MSTLLPPTGVKWDDWSSVCSHPDSAWIAVMNAQAKSLDIFNKKGEFSFNCSNPMIQLFKIKLTLQFRQDCGNSHLCICNNIILINSYSRKIKSSANYFIEE